jgi:hypothetical protein
MDKNRDIIEALHSICMHREEFDELFKDRVKVLYFRAQRYKDSMSYDKYVEVKMLYNKLRYLLDLCSDIDIDDVVSK